MPIHAYRGILPRLGERVFLAPTAHLSGDVEVGDDSSFWFSTAARGDVHRIRVGARTNVQDGAVLHVTHETHPLAIGDDVVIAHGAIVHGCTLESGCLVGIGARVLDGAVVESGAMVAAGALVTPGQTVPGGTLALGSPAKIVRPLSEAEQEEMVAIAIRYVGVKESYLEELGRGY